MPCTFLKSPFLKTAAVLSFTLFIVFGCQSPEKKIRQAHGTGKDLQ